MSFFLCDQVKAFPSQTPNGFSNSNGPDVGGGGGSWVCFFPRPPVSVQVTPCEESSHLHRNLARDK